MKPTSPRPVEQAPTAPSPSSSQKGFLGWRMLALAILTSTMTGPGQTIGVSVFIDHLVADLSLSRSAVSTAYLVGTLAGAAAMPSVGRFVDRRGIRLTQILVGFAFTLALVNMSFVNGLAWLVVGFAGIRMMGQGALSMISGVTVSLWFERRRGLAMGILATVASAGMALVPIGLNAAIEATEWRTAWLIAAAAVLALVVVPAWLFLVDRPSLVGQLPDGSLGDPGTSTDGVEAEQAARSLDRGQAVRTREFWILVAVASSVSMLITALNFHQIDLLGEAGLDAQQAAAMFLPQIIGSSVAGLAFGWLMDRVGVRFAPAVSAGLFVLAFLLAASLNSGAAVFVYAVLLGATMGSTRAVTSTMTPAYFGVAHIGSIQGLMSVAMVGGSAAGPVTLSLLEEWLGSYQRANLMLTIIPVALLLFALTNRRPHRL